MPPFLKGPVPVQIGPTSAALSSVFCCSVFSIVTGVPTVRLMTREVPLWHAMVLSQLTRSPYASALRISDLV